MSPPLPQVGAVQVAGQTRWTLTCWSETLWKAQVAGATRRRQVRDILTTGLLSARGTGCPSSLGTFCVSEEKLGEIPDTLAWRFQRTWASVLHHLNNSKLQILLGTLASSWDFTFPVAEVLLPRLVHQAAPVLTGGV